MTSFRVFPSNDVAKSGVLPLHDTYSELLFRGTPGAIQTTVPVPYDVIDFECVVTRIFVYGADSDYYISTWMTGLDRPRFIFNGTIEQVSGVDVLEIELFLPTDNLQMGNLEEWDTAGGSPPAGSYVAVFGYRL